MKIKYKSILNQIAITRDSTGESERGGFKLCERDRAIRLALPSSLGRETHEVSKSRKGRLT